MSSYIYIGKGKGHPITGHKGREGELRYSSTLSLTSALDGVGGQRQASTALPPGKTRYPLYGRLGGPQGRSGRLREISSSPGVALPTTLFRPLYICIFLYKSQMSSDGWDP